MDRPHETFVAKSWQQFSENEIARFQERGIKQWLLWS